MFFQRLLRVVSVEMALVFLLHRLPATRNCRFIDSLHAPNESKFLQPFFFTHAFFEPHILIPISINNFDIAITQARPLCSTLSNN